MSLIAYDCEDPVLESTHFITITLRSNLSWIGCRVPSRVQIDIFKNYSDSIKLKKKNKKTKKKQLKQHRKCEYKVQLTRFPNFLA